MTPRTPRRIELPAICVACTLLALLTSTAIAQDQLWIRQPGVPGDDGISALAPDTTGGVFVAGYRYELVAPATTIAYLARYDEKGRRNWNRQIGAGSVVRLKGLDADGSGGVFIAGSSRGTFGGSSNNRDNAFVLRFDERGTMIWTTLFETQRGGEAFDVASDNAGGAYVTGHTLDSTSIPSTGGADAFVSRIDSAGDVLWTRRFGSNLDDRSVSVAHNVAGGAFVAGYTFGEMGGLNRGDIDAFLARVSESGNVLWIHQIASRKRDRAFAVASDGEGGAYVAGRTEFILNGLPRGNESAFIIRVDADGNRLWTRQFGSYGREIARALTPDGEGGVIVAGELQTDFVTPGTVPQHAFAVRYDKDGNQLWLRRLSSGTSDTAFAIATDTRPGHTLAFTFAGTTRGDLGGPNAGREDAFIARFGDRDCFIADCDQTSGPGVLDIFDFLCFQLAFALNDPYACDCDTSTGPRVCDVFDFLCFQDAFVRGCS